MSPLRLGLIAVLACVLIPARAQEPLNLCPNPGAEEGADGKPVGWVGSVGASEWATDQVHSGQRSLKLHADEEGTWSWTSDMIPLPRPGCRLALSVWAKYEQISGPGGPTVVLYHTDENGERLTTGAGGSGSIYLGGAGSAVTSTDWRQHVTFSEVTPETRGVRVNLRLNNARGTAWFDDIRVFEYEPGPLPAARPLRRGVWLSAPQGAAIVSCIGGEAQAERIRRALAEKGFSLPVLSHDRVDLTAEKRDLIVLGNLANSKAMEHLYLNYYTFADRYYPGGGGWTLRPQVDPLGTGGNILVLEASDDAGLAAGVEALLAVVRDVGQTLDVPLTVKLGEGYLGTRFYPWPGPGGMRATEPAAEYLKTGDVAYAEAYKKYVFDNWFKETDESYADRQNMLHLIYHSRTQSWDLMDSCPVFSDQERLTIVNELLRLMRSNQASGYAGLTGAYYARGNHDIRNARSFYFGWRHFRKYYAGALEPELVSWTRKLEDFWGLIFSSTRTGDEGISQHAFGGSTNCLLDVAFMEPGWAEEFFAEGRDVQMGERALVCCNNMGETVLLGDTSSGDYPSGVFAKLAWKHHDGRYQFMIDKRGSSRSHVDEAFRAFAIGLEPTVPTDHIGLRIIPADRLYFTVILETGGVTPEMGFDKLAFREGFDPDDEYLMLDGVGGGGHAYDDANTIGEFSAHSRVWLTGFDRFNAPTLSFHNAVTVAQNGLGAPNDPQAAEMVAHSSGEGWAWTHTRLRNYNGVHWNRHILWQPDRYTFVLDDLEAVEPGDYSFVSCWRSLGAPSLERGVLTCAQDEPEPGAVVVEGRAISDAVTTSSGKILYHNPDENVVRYMSETVGDFFELPVVVPTEADWELLVTPSRHPTRGAVSVTLGGQPIGDTLLLYTDPPGTGPPVSMGTRHLRAGPHLLRFTLAALPPGGSTGAMAFTRVMLRNLAQAQPDPALARHRFHLAYPAELPAGFERDTVVLGPGLPVSPYRDQAINILELPMGRSLQPGEHAGFPTAFAATAGAQVRDLRLRRLTESAALVRSGDEVELVGMNGAVALGDLKASGMVFRIGASGVLLHEATAALAGAPLKSGAPPDAERLRAALRQAWEAAQPPDASASTGPWAASPRLKPAWSADLPAEPLSVATVQGRVAVGLRSGQVLLRDNTGATVAEFSASGPVRVLHAADLNGAGTPELLAGSDDEHVYALNADLSERWRHHIPFEVKAYLYWSLGTSAIQTIHTDDITGDGVPEVLAGAGDMRVHCLSASGDELWSYETQFGVPSTVTTADLYRDGRRLVLATNGVTSSNTFVHVLDGAGKKLRLFSTGGQKTNTRGVAVADLDGDGVNSVFLGNGRGNVYAWPIEPPDRPQVLWIQNMTRPVRKLLVLPGGLLAVASDSGYLCAFNQAGEKVWGLPLSSAITHLELMKGGALLAAGCRDGKVFVTTPDGELMAWLDAGGRLQDMAAGGDELVIASAGPDRVTVVKVP